MTRPSPWAVVLLACFCSAIGAHATLVYKKKLELLSAISKEDSSWRHVLAEGIVYELDRTHYKEIIDDELLKNARCEPEASEAVADGEATSSEKNVPSSPPPPQSDTRDRIVPYEFIRNIMAQRYVVGSIVEMGLDVLKISFKCLLYKHLIHLTKLIHVEMQRNTSQLKAASWSGKSIEVIESILMTMGSLQFTDEHLLDTFSFFNIYQTKGERMVVDVKDKYANLLDKRSDEMLDYVSNNCVLKPKHGDDKTKKQKQVAKMIGVFTVKNLYNTGGSFVESSDYKNMIRDSREKMTSVFGNIPWINGMSKFSWHSLLHAQETQHQN